MSFEFVDIVKVLVSVFGDPGAEPVARPPVVVRVG
jgi:hypothetical protein